MVLCQSVELVFPTPFTPIQRLGFLFRVSSATTSTENDSHDYSIDFYRDDIMFVFHYVNVVSVFGVSLMMLFIASRFRSKSMRREVAAHLLDHVDCVNLTKVVKSVELSISVGRIVASALPMWAVYKEIRPNHCSPGATLSDVHLTYLRLSFYLFIN